MHPLIFCRLYKICKRFPLVLKNSFKTLLSFLALPSRTLIVIKWLTIITKIMVKFCRLYDIWHSIICTWSMYHMSFMRNWSRAEFKTLLLKNTISKNYNCFEKTFKTLVGGYTHFKPQKFSIILTKTRFSIRGKHCWNLYFWNSSLKLPTQLELKKRFERNSWFHTLFKPSTKSQCCIVLGKLFDEFSTHLFSKKPFFYCSGHFEDWDFSLSNKCACTYITKNFKCSKNVMSLNDGS